MKSLEKLILDFGLWELLDFFEFAYKKYFICNSFNIYKAPEAVESII